MHFHIIAVGQKMPAWCNSACIDYLTRLQRFFKCTLTEVPTASRHKNTPTSAYLEEEGRKILQKIPSTAQVVALAVEGQMWSSAKLAQAMSHYQQQGDDLFFLIGGPDGLSKACLDRADHHWSLSALTFPHALVRVLLLEQLYRAGSMLANHPYHRE